MLLSLTIVMDEKYAISTRYRKLAQSGTWQNAHFRGFFESLSACFQSKTHAKRSQEVLQKRGAESHLSSYYYIRAINKSRLITITIGICILRSKKSHYRMSQISVKQQGFCYCHLWVAFQNFNFLQWQSLFV